MLQVSALIHVLSHPAFHLLDPAPWGTVLDNPPGFCRPSLFLPSKAQPVPARLSHLTLVMVVRREGETDTVGSGTCVLARRGLFVIFRPVPALGLTGKRGGSVAGSQSSGALGFQGLERLHPDSPSCLGVPLFPSRALSWVQKTYRG